MWHSGRPQQHTEGSTDPRHPHGLTRVTRHQKPPSPGRVCQLPACHNSKSITCFSVRQQLSRQTREPEVRLEPKQSPWIKLGSNVGPRAPPMSLERGRGATFKVAHPKVTGTKPGAGSSVLAKSTLTEATNSHVSRQRTLLSALLVCLPLSLSISRLNVSILTIDLALATRAVSATSS